MATPAGYVLSREAVIQTRDAVRQVLGNAPPLGQAQARTFAAPGTRYQGVLTSDLAAPSNGWTGATTATMTVWLPDPSGAGDPVAFDASSPAITITIVNRDTSLSAASGTFCKAEFINGEWSLYWVSC